MRFIVLGVIGFIVGLGCWNMKMAGYFQPWKKLPAPPQKASQLISEKGGIGFIKTSDGSTYSYARAASWQKEGWVQVTAPSGISDPAKIITQPCDFSSSEFSFLSNPPRNITDCVQEETMYGDGFGRYTIVLNNNGDVWEWSYITTAYEDLTGMVALPCFGLFIGIAIAFLVKIPNSDKNKL